MGSSVIAIKLRDKENSRNDVMLLFCILKIKRKKSFVSESPCFWTLSVVPSSNYVEDYKTTGPHDRHSPQTL
jgi:hypothetical protein